MDYKYIKLVIKDNGSATLTLNRPQVHNAFNDEFLDELIAALEHIDNLDHLRTLIITATGKSFCAGADLAWMKKQKSYSREENIKDSQKLTHFFNKLNSFKMPIIAGIQGNAFGGGVGIIAACDYVVSCSSIKMAFSEVRLGLIPAVISPFVLAKIGESFARAYFLSGISFDARTALNMGLIHQIAEDNLDLTDKLEAITNSILQNGPQATTLAKQLIFNVSAKTSNCQQLSQNSKLHKYTTNAISQTRVSEEGQEGMQALTEKRAPQFK